LGSGDEIVAVNDVPYVNGLLSEGAVEWITRPTPRTPVKGTSQRIASSDRPTR
jgi:hypothetical protein